jgi:CRP/FNR family cyclic AMP-dependent transcriptional regulator
MTDQLNVLTLKKDEVLCKEGDKNTDMYIIHSGELLVCVRKGTQVTPLAYLPKGEYIGELSFFDGESRSADIIATEESKIIRIPNTDLEKKLPRWLITLAQFQTKKLRLMDSVIRDKGIKKKKLETVTPLSIDDQRYYLEIINNS